MQNFVFAYFPNQMLLVYIITVKSPVSRKSNYMYYQFQVKHGDSAIKDKHLSLAVVSDWHIRRIWLAYPPPRGKTPQYHVTEKFLNLDLSTKYRVVCIVCFKLYLNFQSLSSHNVPVYSNTQLSSSYLFCFMYFQLGKEHKLITECVRMYIWVPGQPAQRQWIVLLPIKHHYTSFTLQLLFIWETAA